MSQQALIFDIREDNLDSLVLQNSHRLPVILEFLAVNSEPCISLEQTFTELAKDYAGQFIFAKVDIDEQPELAKQFDIQNVPTTFIMQNAEITEAIEGLIQPLEATTLLRGLGVFHPSDDMREHARLAYVKGDIAAAIQLLGDAAKLDPRNPRVALDMVQIMIDLDQLDQAKQIYNQLPDNAKQSVMGKALLGQFTFKDLASKTLGKIALEDSLVLNPNQPDVLFDLAICLVAEHAYAAALEQLVDLYQQNKHYKDGAAKELIVTITNMLDNSNPDLAKQFRKRFANLNAA